MRTFGNFFDTQSLRLFAASCSDLLLPSFQVMSERSGFSITSLSGLSFRDHLLTPSFNYNSFVRTPRPTFISDPTMPATAEGVIEPAEIASSCPDEPPPRPIAPAQTIPPSPNISPPGAKQKPKEDWSCAQCFVTDTPARRSGPLGRATLCNACGIRIRKDDKSFGDKSGTPKQPQKRVLERKQPLVLRSKYQKHKPRGGPPPPKKQRIDTGALQRGSSAAAHHSSTKKSLQNPLQVTANRSGREQKLKSNPARSGAGPAKPTSSTARPNQTLSSPSAATLSAVPAPANLLSSRAFNNPDKKLQVVGMDVALNPTRHGPLTTSFVETLGPIPVNHADTQLATTKTMVMGPASANAPSTPNALGDLPQAANQRGPLTAAAPVPSLHSEVTPEGIATAAGGPDGLKNRASNPPATGVHIVPETIKASSAESVNDSASVRDVAFGVSNGGGTGCQTMDILQQLEMMEAGHRQASGTNCFFVEDPHGANGNGDVRPSLVAADLTPMDTPTMSMVTAVWPASTGEQSYLSSPPTGLDARSGYTNCVNELMSLGDMKSQVSQRLSNIDQRILEYARKHQELTKARDRIFMSIRHLQTLKQAACKKQRQLRADIARTSCMFQDVSEQENPIDYGNG